MLETAVRDMIKELDLDRQSGARAILPLLALTLTLGPTPAAAAAQPGSSQHAVVSLVAERAAAVPGQPVTMGLHFEIDPHWHIYWQNPGDSGAPPAIEWKLPEGFQASGFEWPVPQRIVIGGNIVNYGYEADVLLPLTIRVPASAKPGTPAELAGRVRYMICSDLCVPARADVHLTLPIAASAGAGAGSPSPSASLFAQTRSRLPQPAPAGWKVSATYTSASRQFDLAIDAGPADAAALKAGAQFFPLTAGQIDDSSPHAPTPTARGVRLTLRASDQLATAPHRLTGIIVLSDTRAFAIDAPIAQPR